eukprot:412373_1
MGGYSDSELKVPTDSIQILNISNRNPSLWTVVTCIQRCPHTGICSAAITNGANANGKLLVPGYIRWLFKPGNDCENVSFPAQYLVKIMKVYYQCETLHWVQDSKHYGCSIGLM